MKKLDLNDICLHLHSLYKGAKKAMEGESSDWPEAIVDEFRNRIPEAILHGAKLTLKAERENAAENTFVMSGMESIHLQTHGKVVMVQRLSFKETTEETMRSLMGAVVEKCEFVPVKNGEGIVIGRKVQMLKSDGDVEFTVLAEDPMPHLEQGKTYWVAEPFAPIDGAAGSAMAAWSDIPAAVRAKIPVDMVRPASAFPKYLQQRRLVLEKLVIGTDYRNGWLEYHLREEEPFDQASDYLENLAKELGLTSEDATAESQEESQVEFQEPDQVDATSIDLTDSGIGEDHETP